MVGLHFPHLSASHRTSESISYKLFTICFIVCYKTVHTPGDRSHTGCVIKYSPNMIRKTPLSTGNIYHVFNKGVNKQKIFNNENDYQRFYYAAIHYKTKSTRFSYEKRLKINHTPGVIQTLTAPRVQVIAYCFMQNHFHFLIKQLIDGGISSYIQRLTNGYSRYVNIKYKREGPLFQSRFKNVLIETDEQLVHVSRYIHLNPVVSNLVSNIRGYKWSSYLNYIDNNKDELCELDLVKAYFKSGDEYENFVLDNIGYGKELEKIKHQIIE